MNWQLKKFEALSNTELYRILQLRSAVFVVEQNCIYLDMDGMDIGSHHLFLKDETDESIIAYSRILPPGVHYKEPSIGRVVSNPEKRRTGMGKILMQEAIAACSLLYPGDAIQIGAQLYLKKFYEGLGFRQTSDIYLEDGISHIKMIFTR
jgi:ElaA protein